MCLPASGAAGWLVAEHTGQPLRADRPQPTRRCSSHTLHAADPGSWHSESTGSVTCIAGFRGTLDQIQCQYTRSAAAPYCCSAGKQVTKRPKLMCQYSLQTLCWSGLHQWFYGRRVMSAPSLLCGANSCRPHCFTCRSSCTFPVQIAMLPVLYTCIDA